MNMFLKREPSQPLPAKKLVKKIKTSDEYLFLHAESSQIPSTRYSHGEMTSSLTPPPPQAPLFPYKNPSSLQPTLHTGAATCKVSSSTLIGMSHPCSPS
jgi:hypothetical protein